jgi:site-specific recombinase XerD
LVVEYREWLVGERGLAEPTVVRYDRLARRFLAARVSDAGELDAAGLTGAEVSAFLLEECARISLGSAKGRVAELRSLLRFLYLRGHTERALADSLPSVAGWRDTEIPATMPPADVGRLLNSCDRSTLGGTRNYAIMLLLARLGLRSIEVARMELEDLDWRAGELAVRGKARRHDRLPLPADVGEAMAEYLSLRGKRGSRHVFLTVKAPTRPIRADLVGDVVERACLRAGIAHVGAHRLRHTFASELLRAGASLVDISQLLRHSDLATTAVYAKVDLDRLRQVARPWPRGSR